MSNILISSVRAHAPDPDRASEAHHQMDVLSVLAVEGREFPGYRVDVQGGQVEFEGASQTLAFKKSVDESGKSTYHATIDREVYNDVDAETRTFNDEYDIPSDGQDVQHTRTVTSTSPLTPDQDLTEQHKFGGTNLVPLETALRGIKVAIQTQPELSRAERAKARVGKLFS